MNVKLADGSILSPIVVLGGPNYVQGETRDCLSFVFPESAGMEALDAAFTDVNCESITIVENNGMENIHKGYTIRSGLKKEAVEVSSATAEAQAQYENRITVIMAQRTYEENQIASLVETVDILVMDALV